jgi:mitochondrial Rho GTPase 1
VQGVGKTSLITAAATESFPDFPPPVLPPTRLPAEATPEGVPMVIVDTSSREEEKTSLDVSDQFSMQSLMKLLGVLPGQHKRHMDMQGCANNTAVAQAICMLCHQQQLTSIMQAACNAADVIVLLFATDRDDALARIGSHWLPELRRIGVRAPVILVGTKSDKKSTNHDLQQVNSMH